MSQDVPIRLAVFFALVVLLVAAEAAWPRRGREAPRAARWPNNLLLVASNSLLVRLLVPLAPVALAATREGQGLLGLTGLPPWAAGVVGFLLLDLAVYVQHLVFHRVPWLWRLHRLHHADVDLDVTSGLRFHPIEIGLSLAYKLALVWVLGVPAAAVLAFEIVLNGMAMFNHANLAIPVPVDRVLRLVLVTPDVHRIHHSIHPAEHHANFGFHLTWWDRLFRTWVPEPRDGQTAMTIGLRDFRDPSEFRLPAMWTQPFRAPAPQDAAPPAYGTTRTS